MDRDLIDRAKRGDREAFETVVRQVGDRCMGIAFRILRDADLAHDAVQAALITAWCELRSLHDPDRFEPWLHRILTNACYAEARRRRRSLVALRIVPVEETYGPDEMLTVQHRDELERAFRRLTVEQRAVLVFHYYLGLSTPEIGQRLGIPLGTVKSRLYHAMAALRAAVDADARPSSPQQERPA